MGASIAAVVVAYEAGDDLRSCVRALLAADDVTEVCVVDNGSSDGSTAGLEALDDRVRVVADGPNDGFGGGANRGIAATTAPIVAVCNPDVLVEPSALRVLAAIAERGAICGPLLDTTRAAAVWGGWEVDVTGMAWQARPGRAPLFVQGACLVATRDDLRRIGGFDTRYFLFAEDLELCWRALRAGLDVRVVPEATVGHLGGGSLAGGYYTDGEGFSTSGLRLTLGARNQLAAILTCAPPSLAAVMVPAAVAKTLAMAVVLAVLGRRSVSRELLTGLGWNARELRTTLARRRSCPSTRAGRREAARRIAKVPLAPAFLLRHGRPTVL